MTLQDLKWSPGEKKIARKAFDKAYKKEMAQIRSVVFERIKESSEENDVWRLHDYLTKKRKEVDRKYDYRYSVLIWVFAGLIRDGLISMEDLQGLSDEKTSAIKTLLDL